ncbi:MAG: Ig-like domain-containing protein [Lachnospiraceae bacterium]|nr:Ig-like domain-containing protein [Lachnospiraceae bacterium]MDD7326872.1 Ig-like domain-containing protein [Lachnospiraceae bacterium]MDY2759541.1 Ig-like domain-containing protein [Lachnospiraceae bacterium]
MLTSIEPNHASGVIWFNDGVAYILVSGYETTAALALDEAYVTVNYSSSKAASTLAVTSDKKVNLKVGDTAQIVASGTAITYTSADPSIATVDATGKITAASNGATVITVASPADDTHMAGQEYVTVIVSQEGEITTKPAKVTSVKVSNKKGAYVSVKWASQGKNICYRVYKKVGSGKWVAKNVTSNKATLSVKKGAKVTVKVKAFVKGTDGKTVWGPKATSKSFKTDKK